MVWCYLFSLDFHFGTIIPLLFKRINVDPAVATGATGATGSFVTTVIDVLGILSYFGLAQLLLF